MSLDSKQDKLLTLIISLFLGSILITGWAAMLDPVFGAIGTHLWITSFGFLFLLAFINGFQLFESSLKNRSYATILTILIAFTSIAIYISDPKNISHETTQQAACILDRLAQDADYGFNSKCFLGYPSRQYLIPVIPTLLLGRSQLSLNLGGSLYFMVGIVIFAKGLFGLFKQGSRSDIITAITLSLIFHFHHLNHVLFHYYEQSNYPFSLSLIVIGLFLQYLKGRQRLFIPLLGLALQYVVFSYTPSLAFAALAILALLYLSHKILQSKKLSGAIFMVLIGVCTLSGLVSSLSIREDVKIITPENNSLDYVVESQKLIQHLTLNNHGKPFVSPTVNLIFITTLIIGLSFYLRWEIAATSAWMIITLIIATLSGGYAFYGLDYRLHRALVIVPTFLSTFYLILHKIRLPNRILYVLWLLFITLGIQFQHNYIRSVKLSDQQNLVHWLARNHQPDNKPQPLYFIGEAAQKYISINDFLSYLTPDLKVTFSPPPTTQANCTLGPTGYYVLLSTHPCYSTLSAESDHSYYSRPPTILGQNNRSTLVIHLIKPQP